MKNRVMFYLFVVALVILDSVLIRSPNLLGKIGLIIYKYSYLRTFPRTLMTVGSVVGIAVLISEIIRWMTKRNVLKRTVSISILLVFALLSLALLVKTGIDFTAWSYSHTGLRFRIGAYLLPVILVLVFGYALFTLPKSEQPWPSSPVMDEKIKNDMLTVDPKTISVAKMHAYLLGAVTPRPIAFASTVDKDGNVNLSPFSFFNCFGMNPPLLIFSPARRVRDNTTKHTLENVLEVPEVVINVVNYAMVQQASLASTEYPKGINEFVKAGFTEVKSVHVKPPRVAESPVSWECKVVDVVKTGDQGGAGNLVVCEILLMHIREDILDAEGRIDPQKIDTVARLGGDWYCRVHGESLFKVPKPIDRLGIGLDQIPHDIRWSKILTGNDLGMLGNVERLPDNNDVIAMSDKDDVAMAMRKGDDALHLLAQGYLKEGRVDDAWKVLLQKRS